jgi:hypothetical protein
MSFTQSSGLLRQHSFSYAVAEVRQTIGEEMVTGEHGPAVSRMARYGFVTWTCSHRHAAHSVINARAHEQEVTEIHASPCMTR